MKAIKLLLIVALIVGCKSKKVISQSTESFRLVEVNTERKDTIIPGFTIRTQFSIPEIIEREIHDTIRITDPNTAGELKIWKDRFGNLVAQCDDKDQTIERLRERISESTQETSKEIIEKDPRTWWERLKDFIPWWVYLAAGLILGFFLRMKLF